MRSPWREMTTSQWDAAARAYRDAGRVYRAFEDSPQPEPPAPVEPTADDEVPDEPDIEGD